ncbi:MAG TPA: 30S ribosomal protein S3 [Candidatus Portnoybacteria bacterium]|jgi:small subunit ribosomal protein S3|nr:30S ribosomal protein S3 [Candidatus Portnoybacteria bacterium]MDD5751947.1 30S ribosomal protein S3 [Candidatus Portnoybacteria bacterium]HOZ16249.1 30S ribosomal protein S3 [Candidatus Portnoybacteria bacterium]HPH51955.1 30S ribosomal protein S3 [Candidatus Portnoybacteria bacterium]HPJ80144.1 30S ribosomal protein S3 [Candidatus Portnoybacteria bacterium]
MSHRVHPKIFRTKGIEDWQSQWYGKKNYKANLEQDFKIRTFIKKELKNGAINEVIIKRSTNTIHIIIRAGKPGIIIGRGGTGIQELKRRIISKIFKEKIKGIDIKIDVEEIKKAEIQARIIGQAIAEQLERRMPFRRVIKQMIEKVSQNSEVKGIKIFVSGRLNGSEMAREEWLKKGSLPLQTIRANIDYAQINAHTIYGIIGIKIWVNRGEIFE